MVEHTKGKSSIHIARNYAEKKKDFAYQKFWARGYYASTVGHDEETVREYIRSNNKLYRNYDQVSLY